MKTETDKPTAPSAETASNEEAHLPHDRDEKPQAAPENAQHDHNRRPILQAHRDVESGIEDTERIGTPNDVPGSTENG